MDIYMEQTRRGSIDGFKVELFEKDHIYLCMDNSLGYSFLAKGWARRATPEDIEAEGDFSLTMDETEVFAGKHYVKGMVYYNFLPALARYFIIKGWAHQATDAEIKAQTDWAFGKTEPDDIYKPRDTIVPRFNNSFIKLFSTKGQRHE